MGLPPISVLFEPVTCFPAWHALYAPLGKRSSSTIVHSGCATIDGNVRCSPSAMAADAAKKVGFPVSLEAYTLARYMASEVGDGPAEEKIAVAQAALNRAKYIEKLPRGILDLLLYRQKATNPHFGSYGPIHGPGGVSTAPYGRWASTSRDPTHADLVLAQAVMSGAVDGFNKGADDQMGPELLDDPVGSISRHGAKRSYWVGPLPGVDPWRTIQYRYLKNVAPDSQFGQALIARGIAAMKAARPKWDGLPVCADQRRIDILPTAAVLAGGTLLGLFLSGLVVRRLHAVV